MVVVHPLNRSLPFPKQVNQYYLWPLYFMHFGGQMEVKIGRWVSQAMLTGSSPPSPQPYGQDKRSVTASHIERETQEGDHASGRGLDPNKYQGPLTEFRIMFLFWPGMIKSKSMSPVFKNMQCYYHLAFSLTHTCHATYIEPCTLLVLNKVIFSPQHLQIVLRQRKNIVPGNSLNLTNECKYG